MPTRRKFSLRNVVDDSRRKDWDYIPSLTTGTLQVPPNVEIMFVF